MFMRMNINKINRVFNAIMATIVFVAIFYVTTLINCSICMAATDTVNHSEYDDEIIFSKREECNDITKFPEDIKWKEKGVRRVIDGHDVRYILRDKRARVYIDKRLIWQSDETWFVEDMFVGDIDKDSTKDKVRKSEKSEEEFVLLLWKEGRFGQSHPFFIKDDEKDYSQHIFTYNIEAGKLIEKWCSSYIGENVSEMVFSDDTLYLTHLSGKKSRWKWFSFGFEKLESVNILVAGDNLMHKEIYEDILKNHNSDFEFLYNRIGDKLKESDLSIINLETPLVYDASMYSTYPCFGTPVSVAKGIKDAGFDGVTLSTNHRLDKGITGIEDTIKALDEYDLIHVGSMDEKPYVIVKRNEIEFALLNYTYGTNGIKVKKGYENSVNYLDDEEKIREDIREAKKNSDCVIVFVHWGNEYTKEPVKSQLIWRDVFYEEGVDIVVGTHPHVIQKYEMYKEKNNDREMLIYYSLGNFVSANQRKDHNSGGIGTFTVTKSVDGIEISDEEFFKIETIYPNFIDK